MNETDYIVIALAQIAMYLWTLWCWRKSRYKFDLAVIFAVALAASLYYLINLDIGMKAHCGLDNQCRQAFVADNFLGGILK